MLNGRESLRRLIGKRRRSFSSPLARRLRPEDDFDPGEAISVKSKEHEAVADGSGESGNAGELGSEPCVELVSCPVCTALVPGDDFTVNSHLDTCLSSGKKRKLIQRTLLQVNFLSKSRQETCLIGANNHNVDKYEKEVFEEKKHSNLYPTDYFMLFGSCERCESVESLNHPYSYNSESSSQTPIVAVDEKVAKRKAVDSHFSSTFPSIIRLPRSDSGEDDDTKHVYTLETLIVGRRFHEKVELHLGGRVYVQREHQNVKDDNAIKLCYLPRCCATIEDSDVHSDIYHANYLSIYLL